VGPGRTTVLIINIRINVRAALVFQGAEVVVIALVGPVQEVECHTSSNRITVDQAHRTFMAKHLSLVLDFVAADTKIMVAVDVLRVQEHERAVTALDSNNRKECPYFHST
jgi:hypothetical protein